VAAVADDVPAVRLARGDRDEQAARQPRPPLGGEAGVDEAVGARPGQLGLELLCSDRHFRLGSRYERGSLPTALDRSVQADPAEADGDTREARDACKRQRKPSRGS
jgi:hypothetical protein